MVYFTWMFQYIFPHENVFPNAVEKKELFELFEIRQKCRLQLKKRIYYQR